MRPLSERIQIPLLILIFDICLGVGLIYQGNLTVCEAARQPSCACFFIFSFAFKVTLDVLKAPDLPHPYHKWLIALKFLLISLMIFSATKTILIAHEQALECVETTVFPLNARGYLLNFLQSWCSEYCLKRDRPAGQRNSSLSQWLSDHIGLFPKEKEKLTREFSQFCKGEILDTCSVCYEDYKSGEQIMTLPKCSHIFHGKCVLKWLKRTPVCPLCRMNVRRALYSNDANK